MDFLRKRTFAIRGRNVEEEEEDEIKLPGNGEIQKMRWWMKLEGGHS